MAKRKQPPAEEGSPAWMSTFSDLMNLLMCFFVLLFASSTMDAEKIQKIAASFNDISFSILESGSVSLVDGQIVSGGVTQLPGIESFLEHIGVSSKVEGNNSDLSATGSDADEDGTASSDEYTESVENIQATDTTETTVNDAQQLSQQELKEQLESEGLEQSEQMYDEISQMSESYKIDDRIVMDYNSQYVSLDLNGAILFDPGDADIRSDARLFMQKIASVLSKYDNSIIEIEGHTDNIPIHNSKYESNLYLSTARASKVYEFILAESKLHKENLKVAGYGDTHPVASNDTEEGRAKNRRVSIKIYNSLNSNVVEDNNN
ncbi:MAG: flagellar motor protein MotB [Lachnospiraceae bacterium]